MKSLSVFTILFGIWNLKCRNFRSSCNPKKHGKEIWNIKLNRSIESRKSQIWTFSWKQCNSILCQKNWTAVWWNQRLLFQSFVRSYTFDFDCFPGEMLNFWYKMLIRMVFRKSIFGKIPKSNATVETCY